MLKEVLQVSGLSPHCDLDCIQKFPHTLRRHWEGSCEINWQELGARKKKIGASSSVDLTRPRTKSSNIQTSGSPEVCLQALNKLREARLQDRGLTGQQVAVSIQRSQSRVQRTSNGSKVSGFLRCRCPLRDVCRGREQPSKTWSFFPKEVIT